MYVCMYDMPMCVEAAVVSTHDGGTDVPVLTHADACLGHALGKLNKCQTNTESECLRHVDYCP